MIFKVTFLKEKAENLRMMKEMFSWKN